MDDDLQRNSLTLTNMRYNLVWFSRETLRVVACFRNEAHFTKHGDWEGILKVSFLQEIMISWIYWTTYMILNSINYLHIHKVIAVAYFHLLEKNTSFNPVPYHFLFVEYNYIFTTININYTYFRLFSPAQFYQLLTVWEFKFFQK